MRASEDEDCSGNDLSSSVWIDVGFQKILLEKKNVMICVGASFCAKYCMKTAISANFITFPGIYFCILSMNNVETYTFILY